METCPAQAGAARGQWLVEWVVRNLGREPLRLLAARAPHGKFRSDELDLASMPDLSPDEGTRLQLLVSCDEPDGAVIENAFLILRLLWRGNGTAAGTIFVGGGHWFRVLLVLRDPIHPHLGDPLGLVVEP